MRRRRSRFRRQTGELCRGDRWRRCERRRGWRGGGDVGGGGGARRGGDKDSGDRAGRAARRGRRADNAMGERRASVRKNENVSGGFSHPRRAAKNARFLPGRVSHFPGHRKQSRDLTSHRRSIRRLWHQYRYRSKTPDDVLDQARSNKFRLDVE